MKGLSKLRDVDPRLVTVLVCGCRDFEQKTDLKTQFVTGFETAKDQRVRSHVDLYHRRGQAVDIAIRSADEENIFYDYDLYKKLDKCIQANSLDFQYHLTWGGHWARHRELGHWQLEVVRSDKDF